mgnify:CR=1 FL=1
MRRTATLLGTTLALMSGTALADDFAVSSDTFADGSTLANTQVFKGFGCEGENISPDLSWTAGPEGTKSYVVNVYDPDAPTGSGWWHWIAGASAWHVAWGGSFFMTSAPAPHQAVAPCWLVSS